MRPFAIALISAVMLLRAAGSEWQQGAGFRYRELSLPGPGKTGFMKPGNTGIQFTNRLADNRSISNRNLLSGSGVAAGDVDGDGLCDLYFCGLDSENSLFRNLG